MKRLLLSAITLLILLAPVVSYARGGGGCFLPDSPVLKPDGTEIRISAVQPGDKLLAFTPEGRLVNAEVRNIIRHEVDEYLLLKTDRQTVRVTRDHPFYVGNGTYKTLEALKVGDTLVAWDGQSLAEQRIVSLEKIRERVPVYNLQTDQPNTFFAGRLAVHNKGGGCFPAGTRIATPLGTALIEDLAPGDEILGVREDGRTVRATVKNLLLARGQTLRIEMDDESVTATQEHPIGLWEGGFRETGRLLPGDRIRQWKDGRMLVATVLSMTAAPKDSLVFNLQVSNPHTFIAESTLVHNKGGGGRSGGSSGSRGSYSRSGSGSGSSRPPTLAEVIIVPAIFGLIVMVVIIAAVKQKKRKSENLDFVYSSGDVSRKAVKTEKLLAFLGQQDPSVLPEELRRTAESTFRKLQECWEKRDYDPMKPLMMSALFKQHLAQIQGMIRNHEINRLENLSVEHVDLVNVRYTEKPDRREFTALISASVRDYYVDDRTGKTLRGDDSPSKFQEFWTFHRVKDQWLLREIEQAGESDYLKDENFAEMLTDVTIQGIYREAAKEGIAGPWLAKGEGKKADRTERLLNFLVQTDKLWDRTRMLERAREVFLGVYLARESGDPDQVPADFLFPEVAESLRQQMRQWRSDGIRVEYRNLCVRKAELILVRNFSLQHKDEFTVRIDAHAQKIVRKGETVFSEQEYVTPFEEFWTFGRRLGEWKLKEVLPPARGRRVAEEENVDEDSSSGQIEWYYRQTRAN